MIEENDPLCHFFLVLLSKDGTYYTSFNDRIQLYTNEYITKERIIEDYGWAVRTKIELNGCGSCEPWPDFEWRKMLSYWETLGIETTKEEVRAGEFEEYEDENGNLRLKIRVKDGRFSLFS